MKIIIHACSIILFLLTALVDVQSQNPELESWLLNDAGTTYNGILVDVETVHYNDTYVWITASGIGSYYADDESRFNAVEQDFVLRVPRNPIEETGSNRSRGAAAIAYCINGTVIYAPGDGQSYNDQDVWNQLAYAFEGRDFDNFNGHSTPPGVYHHHVDNIGVYSASAAEHSPIIGFAADGFPIYGPYGYSDPNDATSSIQRMATSYQKRDISDRTTLPDGTNLVESEYGPSLAEEDLGSYMEDYEYVDASGDLDEHNGRFCITPEYPAGIYAYFTTIDAQGDPEYPYFIGDTYYEDVPSGQFGSNATSQTIAEDAVEYAGALPLTLIDFNIKTNTKSIGLNWTSANEINISQFAIQRLNGNYTWETIGKITAKGNTATTQNYTYIDNKPHESISYYRLQMVDLDRSVAYSPARSVVFAKTTDQAHLSTDIEFFPNPTRYFLNVKDAVGEITISTLDGKILLRETARGDGHAHGHVTPVDVYDLTDGLYLLEIETIAGQTVATTFYKGLKY